MKTGDSVTDTRKRAWTVGPELGRGTWGVTWMVRDEAGRQAVLKVPQSADDHRGRELPEGALAAMATLARESAELLKERAWPFLPVLEGELSLPDGGTGLVVPAYPETLARRIHAGAPLEEVLDVLCRVSRLLVRAGAVHGNLRATNILLDDGGQPFLADPAPPSLGAWARRLDGLRTSGVTPWPPETESRIEAAGVDTFALCRVLLSAVLEGSGVDALPETLDRHALSDLRSAVAGRLAAAGTNPRFRGRVADRIGSLLNRGLAEPREPSPPYRFHRADEFAQRLEEIAALLHPRIVEVGRIMLGPEAQGTVFAGERPASFIVSVEPSAGIGSHDDIHVGLQLFDLDRNDARVPLGEDLSFDARVHASGRLRFAFQVPSIPPGRYRLHVAFGIKDGTLPLTASEVHFEVRPPAGWVPPPDGDALPAPIPLPRPTPDDSAAGLPRPVTPPSDEAPPSDTPMPPALFEPAPTPVAPPPPMPPSPNEGPEPWFSQQRWEPADDGPALPEASAPDDLPGDWDADIPEASSAVDRFRDWFQRDPQTAVVVLLVGSFAALLVLLTLVRLFGG